MNTQKTPRILRYLVGFGLLVAQLQAQSEAVIEVARTREHYHMDDVPARRLGDVCLVGILGCGGGLGDLLRYAHSREALYAT